MMFSRFLATVLLVALAGVRAGAQDAPPKAFVDGEGLGWVALGEGDFLVVGREDALGDVDLGGVQRPGAQATLQEGVAELGFTGGAVGKVAERAVERL